MKADQRLILANVLLSATVLAHGGDHAVQERGLGALTIEVVIGGFANASLGPVSYAVAAATAAAGIAVAAIAAWTQLGTDGR